jgi:hypothetical protein
VIIGNTCCRIGGNGLESECPGLPKHEREETRMEKEITLSEFADELTVRLQQNKTVDCCKVELIRLAEILKRKIPGEKILVNWKED